MKCKNTYSKVIKIAYFIRKKGYIRLKNTMKMTLNSSLLDKKDGGVSKGGFQ